MKNPRLCMADINEEDSLLIKYYSNYYTTTFPNCKVKFCLMRVIKRAERPYGGTYRLNPAKKCLFTGL